MNLSRRGLFQLAFGAVAARFAPTLPAIKPAVVAEPPKWFRIEWEAFMDGKWVDGGKTVFQWDQVENVFPENDDTLRVKKCEVVPMKIYDLTKRE